MFRGTAAAPFPGVVYLLHFEPRYKHAGHYIGWCENNVAARLARHLAGTGGRLPHVAHLAGCSVYVARTWVGDRTLERTLKNRKSAPRMCPVCSAHLSVAERFPHLS